jgi:hypothetical protein
MIFNDIFYCGDAHRAGGSLTDEISQGLLASVALCVCCAGRGLDYNRSDSPTLPRAVNLTIRHVVPDTPAPQLRIFHPDRSVRPIDW